MRLLILVLLSLLFVNHLEAEEKKAGVIYQYKTYEEFDLGNLEIKGEIIAPGDLSVRERERKVFSRNLYEKPNFKREEKRDLDSLR
ncbi:MAG: hypothetical protein HOE90_23050 [Bacteriovoracaceae bacterium]|jgi:hypothetical protein|nr:hypothetical protein [Bacteriovoracaceae bacterium]